MTKNLGFISNLNSNCGSAIYYDTVVFNVLIYKVGEIRVFTPKNCDIV